MRTVTGKELACVRGVHVKGRGRGKRDRDRERQKERKRKRENEERDSEIDRSRYDETTQEAAAKTTRKYNLNEKNRHTSCKGRPMIPLSDSSQM